MRSAECGISPRSALPEIETTTEKYMGKLIPRSFERIRSGEQIQYRHVLPTSRRRSRLASRRQSFRAESFTCRRAALVPCHAWLSAMARTGNKSPLAQTRYERPFVSLSFGESGVRWWRTFQRSSCHPPRKTKRGSTCGRKCQRLNRRMRQA
jgi:hypothetical protein